MSLKREGRGETTDQQFSKILADKYITARWYTLPHVPTLAECRGKMVLVRRFGLDDSVKNLNGDGVGWGIDAENWAYNTQDCTTSSGDIRVQDFCEVIIVCLIMLHFELKNIIKGLIHGSYDKGARYRKYRQED